MSYSEKQREYNDKWDKMYMKSSSYKMYKEVYAAFDQYCNDNKLSKNGVINEYIKNVLIDAGYLKAENEQVIEIYYIF